MQGFTLLNHHCPVCNCPLVQKKPQPEMHCVSCRRTILTEAEYKRRQAAGTAPVVEDAAIAATQAAGGAGPTESQTDMRRRERARKVQSERAPPANVPPLEFSEPTAEELERERQQDEIADRLGSLLQKGWAMLNQYCPTCACTLMRSRQGELFCVSCEKKVGPDGAAQQTQGSTAAEESKAPASAAQTSVQSAVSQPAATQPRAPERKAPSADARVEDTARVNRTAAASLSSMPADRVMQTTASTVVEKMDEAQRALALSQDPRKIASLARVIADLAKALAALRELV